MAITPPGGNVFATGANVVSHSSEVFKDLNRICSLFEDIASKNSRGAHGYSNNEILNYCAGLMYTGANNFGNSTVTTVQWSRKGIANVSWQGNVLLQYLVNAVSTVAMANSNWLFGLIGLSYLLASITNSGSIT